MLPAKAPLNRFALLICEMTVWTEIDEVTTAVHVGHGVMVLTMVEVDREAVVVETVHVGQIVVVLPPLGMTKVTAVQVELLAEKSYSMTLETL